MRPQSLFFRLIVLTVIVIPLRAQHLPEIPRSKPTIQSEDLRHHVFWLASDALEGRGTGTAANDTAAAYIEREFRRYGLTPAGEEGYFQEFDVIKGVSRGSAELSLWKNGVKTPIDSASFIPVTFSAINPFSGPVVFAGYGLIATDKSDGDYSLVDARGAVVLALHGVPEDIDPHDPAAMQATPRAKALAAREAGASALLLVHDAAVTTRTFKWDGSASTAGIPVACISRATAITMLLAAGIDTASLNMAAPAQTKQGEIQVSGRFQLEVIHAKTRNVAALLHGRGAEAAQVIVLGAHYDHLGWGQEGSLYRGNEPMIHNGADDNASGTAGMLELAEYFSAHPPLRSLLFLAFSGEEMGLLGSAHWVSTPTIPLERIIAMVNLDMIGRYADSTRELHVQGSGTSPLWPELVETVNKDYDFALTVIEDGQGASDHSSFYTKGIPVLFFFTGLHADYHRPGDDADKLNYAGLEKVTRFTADIIQRIDQGDTPTFTRVERSEKQQNMRFSVYVGTMPDYGYNGEGFRITGTSPGSPAEKAGLKEGDIIVKFGAITIGNIYDYMAALASFKAGDVAPVMVRRNNENVELHVELRGK